MAFELHPNLTRDAIGLGSFPLSQVLLINDATYPWFVLVPMRSGISDTIDLRADDHATLWAESRIFGAGIMRAFKGDKLNVASIGNITPQLHVHHIVRYKSDATWPGPVWGQHPMLAYSRVQLQAMRDKLLNANIANLSFLTSHSA